MHAEQPETTARRRRKRFALPLLGLVLAFLCIAFGAAYWRTHSEVERLKRDSVSAETQQLTNDIGAHMLLPDEKPALATVENNRKLQGQPFFKHAQKGDKVLIYARSKKAILYRPSVKKVIEVAQLAAETKDNKPSQQ